MINKLVTIFGTIHSASTFTAPCAALLPAHHCEKSLTISMKFSFLNNISSKTEQNWENKKRLSQNYCRHVLLQGPSPKIWDLPLPQFRTSNPPTQIIMSQKSWKWKTFRLMLAYSIITSIYTIQTRPYRHHHVTLNTKLLWSPNTDEHICGLISALLPLYKIDSVASLIIWLPTDKTLLLCSWATLIHLPVSVLAITHQQLWQLRNSNT